MVWEEVERIRKKEEGIIESEDLVKSMELELRSVELLEEIRMSTSCLVQHSSTSLNLRGAGSLAVESMRFEQGSRPLDAEHTRTPSDQLSILV